jgi:hypothetical protein
VSVQKRRLVERLTFSYVRDRILDMPVRVRRRLTCLYWTYRPVRNAGAAHGLSSPLIVSLTSYPARFGFLPLTLKTLLSQSIRPDRVVLWIAEADAERLTPEILSLRRHGLEIRFCEELRSYNKLIHSLEHFPDSYIVTADDDLHYPRDWLKRLVDAAGNPREVICLRAHRIRLGEDGLPRPYLEWDWRIAEEASDLVFPTSGGGALYPPSLFRDRTILDRRFMEICPTADDIWFYWMMRMNGGVGRKVGPSRRYVSWPVDPGGTLAQENVGNGGNDRQIARMIEAFGFPPRRPEPCPEEARPGAGGHLDVRARTQPTASTRPFPSRVSK